MASVPGTKAKEVTEEHNSFNVDSSLPIVSSVLGLYSVEMHLDASTVTVSPEAHQTEGFAKIYKTENMRRDGIVTKEKGGPSATAENFWLPAQAQLCQSILLKTRKDLLLPGVLSNRTVEKCS